MADWLITPELGQDALATVPERFARLLQHGSMSVELYAPTGVDPQKPHAQDEIYVVLRGHGEFFKNGARQPFGPGDVIFVEAGLEHRFENFSEDFATWVIFYGPVGGEAGRSATS